MRKKIGDIDQECEDPLADYCQTIQAKKDHEIQEIDEDRQLKDRKASEENQWELADF